MLYRETYKIDNALIIYEEYTRPSGTINCFVSLLLASFYGNERICFKKYFRKGAAVAYNTDTGEVKALCSEYISRYGSLGVCVGDPQYIEYILHARFIYTVLLPANITLPSCSEERILRRRRGKAMRLCIRENNI